MENCFDKADESFIVLKNAEDQYSLWPQWKDVPGGWQETGMTGNKEECLNFVEENWIDMRPLSLQKWMKNEQLN